MNNHDKNKNQDPNTEGPKGADETTPQPESIHGGNMSDFGGVETKRKSDPDQKPQKELDPNAEKALKDQQPHPEELAEERARPDGLLGGKQQRESAYPNSQGQKLPPADDPDANNSEQNKKKE